MLAMESNLNEHLERVNSKNSYDENLERWRKLCGLVSNPKRRFRFTVNLSKRRANEEKIRVALLVSQAAFKFIQGVEVIVPEDVQAVGYQGLGQFGAWVIDILEEQHWLELVNNSVICSNTWRTLGFVSSVVAMVTYSQSLSFKRIFGEWTSLKMYIYCALSLIVCGMTLMPKICRAVNRFLVKPDVVFLAMMVSTLYSYLYDKFMSGKPDILSLISSGAFSLMSLSVARQNGMGFEVGLTGFFVAFFILQLMKINVTLTSVTVLVAYIFTRLRQ